MMRLADSYSPFANRQFRTSPVNHNNLDTIFVDTPLGHHGDVFPNWILYYIYPYIYVEMCCFEMRYKVDTGLNEAIQTYSGGLTHFRLSYPHF